MKILWGAMLNLQILGFLTKKIEIEGILEFMYSENFYSTYYVLAFWAWGRREQNKIIAYFINYIINEQYGQNPCSHGTLISSLQFRWK